MSAAAANPTVTATLHKMLEDGHQLVHKVGPCLACTAFAICALASWQQQGPASPQTLNMPAWLEMLQFKSDARAKLMHAIGWLTYLHVQCHLTAARHLARWCGLCFTSLPLSCVLWPALCAARHQRGSNLHWAA